MAQSLYQSILQDDFSKMNPILQQIYGPVSNLEAHGIMDIEYGKGLLVKLANKLLRMPSAGKRVKVELRINRSSDREIWARKFNQHVLKTEQFHRNGYLIEKVGSIMIGFKLSVKDGGLEFRQDFACIHNIRLPKVMSINTTAYSKGEGDGWYVNVELTSPVLGLLLRYYGLIKLEK